MALLLVEAVELLLLGLVALEIMVVQEELELHLPYLVHQ